MHFGISIFPTDYAIPLAELAVAAEERGLESLWVAEHSNIPVSRKSPFPGGGDLPKMYYATLDPFVALASAAAVTSRIKLATGICLVVQRDPIHTAKEVASLDVVSKGRFLFGVGAGWNAEEMANHGTTDFKGRFKLIVHERDEEFPIEDHFTNFETVARLINASQPEKSRFLQKPLAIADGGIKHKGGDRIKQESANYENWVLFINGEKGPPIPSEGERRVPALTAPVPPSP